MNSSVDGLTGVISKMRTKDMDKLSKVFQEHLPLLRVQEREESDLGGKEA